MPRGKYPGIILSSQTYNLFGSNRERANAKRKERAWLRGDPFYIAQTLISDKEGNITIQKTRRVTMEYNHVFNPTISAEGHITTPELDSSTGHEASAEENYDGRPEEEVRGVQE
jgi:hypothetical protein